MLSKKITQKKGFTILEMIITAFVISVAFIAVMSLITRTIVDVKSNSSRLTAFYLAQEGIEIVRNIRDSNWLGGENWNNGLTAGSYQADYNDITLFSYPNSYLKINSNGFYNYDEGVNTNFQREITISYPNSAECPQEDCLEVEVKALWSERGNNQSVIVRERLYNWLR